MAEAEATEKKSLAVVEGAQCEMKVSRKKKRKLAKKKKRKEMRREIAQKERDEAEARANDPEEQRKLEMMEKEEEEERQRALKEFEERDRIWFREMERKKEEERRKMLEQEREEKEKEAKMNLQVENECGEDDNWEYVEEGPAEIIWQGNEIIIRKNKVRVLKKDANHLSGNEDADRPTSNPLPPQSEVFADYQNAQQSLETVAQQVPNFGTEQDKAHCPFHLKTGVCRFGQSCSRVHFYPDKSCTLLVKNMYNGPGLAWEQDEGLESRTCKADSDWNFSDGEKDAETCHVHTKINSRYTSRWEVQDDNGDGENRTRQNYGEREHSQTGKSSRVSDRCRTADKERRRTHGNRSRKGDMEHKLSSGRSHSRKESSKSEHHHSKSNEDYESSSSDEYEERQKTIDKHGRWKLASSEGR